MGEEESNVENDKQEPKEEEKEEVTETQNNKSQAEVNLENCHNVPFYKIVMTGGPCGGKTTGLARLYSYLNERGFEVMSCPETYSLLANNGMSANFHAMDGMSNVIQNAVLRVQMSNEDAIERVLRARGKPAVMICDRAIMDGAAYLPKEDWEKIKQQNGIACNTQVRDQRYHAIFHMVTAALGAEEHYTLENNAARTETKDQARALDKITQDSWLGHPHLYVFDNSTNFEEKMSRMIDVMSKIVGLPSNMKRRSAKFLLRAKPNLHEFKSNGQDFRIFHVEKVYLSHTANSHFAQQQSGEEGYSFLRKRTVVEWYETSDQMLTGVNGSSVHQVTNVDFTSDGEMIEQKRIITEREYASAYMTRDHKRHIVHQKRISFIYKMQSFSIHMYEKPLNDLYILHAQVEAKNSNSSSSTPAEGDDDDDVHVDLPPFLDVERRIYNNKEDDDTYGAYSISVIKE